MVLTTAIGVHDGVACHQPVAVCGGDRVDGEACAHVRGDGVTDQFAGAQVEDGGHYVECSFVAVHII